MADFRKGDRVRVFPNTRSLYAEDNDESMWIGTVISVSNMPEAYDEFSYDILPDDDELPRYISAFRVKPL